MVGVFIIVAVTITYVNMFTIKSAMYDNILQYNPKICQIKVHMYIWANTDE
jgi:hypothetical protein